MAAAGAAGVATETEEKKKEAEEEAVVADTASAGADVDADAGTDDANADDDAVSGHEADFSRWPPGIAEVIQACWDGDAGARPDYEWIVSHPCLREKW